MDAGFVTGRDFYSRMEAVKPAAAAPSIPVGGMPGDDEKLKEACRDFEAIFLKMMLNSMRKTVEKTGMTDGGMAEEIFEDMLYDEYAQKMSRTSNLGLAEMIYRQVSQVSNRLDR